MSLALMAFGTESYSQITLRGTVKDTKGDAVVGANVFFANTITGTSTDIEGNFELEVASRFNDSTLIISSIGYATQKFPVRERRIFNVVLADDAKILGEIVVTGYQTEERGKILGAVATVSTELIAKIPVSGVDQALQGRVPGVVVTQNTGAPGEGVQVRIRGIGSLFSSNQPLYIVDGLPTQDISSIAPQDILTLSVLKDASSAAVYGARATNGVILITTKTGSSGKQVIQFNTQIGFQEPVRLVPMASTEQYISIYNEATNADNQGLPIFLQRPLITDAIKAGLPNVDQVKAIMRPSAPLQSYSLSFSGAAGKTNYLLSGSYFTQDGIIKASDYSRLTVRVNLDTEVKKWLTTGINLNVSTSTTNLIGSSGDGAGGNGGSVVRYAYFRSPAIPIFSAATGDYTDKPSDNFNDNNLYTQLFGDGYNPVGMLAYNNNKKLNERLFGKFYIILKPIKGLTFTSNFGVDFTSQNTRRFDRNWGTLNRINNPNRLTVTDERYHTLTFSNFANYTKVFGGHSFTALLGTEAIKGSNYGISSTDTGFPNQNPTLTYLNNGLGSKAVSEGKSGNALLSYFSKISYDFNEKYLASVTVRRDGSSRFGANNRWGTFYAASLGWRVDKESFLLNSSWVNRLLLRAGYGSVGNQEISNYPFSDQIGVGSNYPYGQASSIGFVVSQLGNADVKWESSNQLNVGVDLVTGDGKLSVSLDYFHKKTFDLLVPQPPASSAGSALPAIVNNGEILNQGIELSLNYDNSFGDLRYTISPNVALLRNEVVSVGRPIQAGRYGSLFTTLTETGHPVGSFYMLEMAGIFQNPTDLFTSAKPPGSMLQPGDVKFKDQNGDGFIDGRDRTHLGSAIPTLTAGLNIALNYKNFDLSIFFQGAYGQKILSVINRDIEGFYRPFNVTQRYYENHWSPTNPSNEYPRASWNASGNNAQMSSRFLEDGSYTRLKNIQFGYSLAPDLLKRYGLTAVRFYFSGTNLLTLTPYAGMDPEMTVSDNAKGDSNNANGMDWGTFPAAKTYNFGVNITF